MRRTIEAVLVAAGLVLPVPAVGQLPQTSPADTGAWWHRAEALRPVVDRDGGPADSVVALAYMEFGLRRPERVVALLEHGVDRDTLPAPTVVLLGTARFLVGDYLQAARDFDRAADRFTGEMRGVVLARAAEAFRLAGEDSLALDRLARARAALRQIEGWLAVRQAVVTPDPALALSLLRRAPPEAAGSAARVRAAVLLSAGDSARAFTALMQSRQWAVALQVAAATGDTAGARRAAYEALLDQDSVTLRAGVTAVRERFPPHTQEERFVFASALRQTGRTRDAIALLESAAAAGDSSSALLRRVGDLQSSIGARTAALATYEIAAAQDDGPDAPLAAYRRARLLTRGGRGDDGYADLAAFANGYPDHESAPIALYLVASWHGDRGLVKTADSIFADVAARWTTDRYASRARIRLAQAALVAGDTGRAIDWYRQEADAGAEEVNAARYFLGVLGDRIGDSASAREQWTRLARTDSVGYYGTLARGALGHAPPAFASPPAVPASPAADLTLRRVDLLYASFLVEEAEEVIARQLRRREFEEAELLALAAGLLERGWVQEGTTLGWRAARTRSLNDPLVVRLVFPFPMREMVVREAKEHGLDPYLVAGLIRQESNFRPTVVSRAGAVGLMQLMPPTGRELMRREGVRWDERLLRVAEVNLHLGTRHLATLLERYDGAVVPALAAYNAGARPVTRWLRYPEAADSVQFVERIPYVETRGYVRAVLRNRVLYRALYPGLDETTDHEP